MLNLLQKETFNYSSIKDVFGKIIQIYHIEDVSQDRKEYLNKTIEKYGYIPYPHYKALSELTDSETVYTMVKILEKEGTCKNLKLIDCANPSILYRLHVKNSDWFKKETQNIKLISLSGLGDGNKTDKTGTFIEWIKQIICLPKGNRKLGVLADTVYLLPFHPREFGCAYLPSSSDVSGKIEDEKLLKFTGLDAKKQVKLFIALAQLMGHPVIYDILPQTGRFSKIILANPYAARWMNVYELEEKYIEALNKISLDMKIKNEFEEEKIENTKEKYISELQGNPVSYDEIENKIKDKIESLMKDIKINLTNETASKACQEKILKSVKYLIEKVNGKKVENENDIIKQEEIVKTLIKEGFWTMSGGAWCSSGVPVYDKMSKNREYPICKHYDYKGEDVTKFANLDCQTPYYFTYFDLKKYNEKVINFYVNYTGALQKEYNFDGFRVDHIDHVVDDFSEKDGFPISYRIPRKVLGKVNSNLKKNVPYFANLAEYMLWDNYYLEYHKDMNFDLLWGNDIVSQSSKTPKQILEDNKILEDYNLKNGKGGCLSILKTYNNQDGEFEAINRYPAQLQEAGALFKWFKFKFIPGGQYANRPSLYIDGDESFTKTGIEYIIGHEVSMKRNDNWGFYEKFNAINYFAQNSEILINGKAKLLEEKENGLCCWEINSKFGSLLVISNYKNPSELMEIKNEEGQTRVENIHGETIYNSVVDFGGRALKSYFEFCYDELQKCVLVEKPLENKIENQIEIGVLKPAEFKIYGFED